MNQILILIAEDEYRLAAFIEKGLKKHGFAAVQANDGDEALTMAQSGAYDLMLLDLGLPGKDGLEVLQELRSQGAHMPVIVVSARTDEREVASGLAGGANDYVTKPFSFKDLLNRIYQQLAIVR